MAQQKNGAQINAVTNRIDLNIKTPSAASSFRNALGIISCRGAGQGRGLQRATAPIGKVAQTSGARESWVCERALRRSGAVEKPQCGNAANSYIFIPRPAYGEAVPSPPSDLNGAQRLNGLNDMNCVNFGANRTHRRARNNRRSHARWASGGRHRFRLSYGNNYNPRGVGILCDRAALYSQRARRRK